MPAVEMLAKEIIFRREIVWRNDRGRRNVRPEQLLVPLISLAVRRNLDA
jgi:hypothetical protein